MPTTKGTKVTTTLCRRAIRVFWSKIFKRCLTRNYLFAVTWKMMKKMNKLLSRVFQSFCFNRSLTLKFWQNKKDRNLFEMPTKNYVSFSATSCKKDIIFDGHLKQIPALLFRQGFTKATDSISDIMYLPFFNIIKVMIS